MKWHIVVMLVDLVEPLSQRLHRNPKVCRQTQLDEHGLHETDYLRVIKLVAIEGWQSEGCPHLLREHIITDIEEAPLHLLVLTQARLSVR